MTEAQETGGADGAPIVSIGADVDVEALVAEVKAEVARKAEAGFYPPELLVEVNQDSLGVAVVALRHATHFSNVAPVGSGRAHLAGGVSLVKRLIAKALGWHTRWILDQVYTFGSNVPTSSTAPLAPRPNGLPLSRRPRPGREAGRSSGSSTTSSSRTAFGARKRTWPTARRRIWTSFGRRPARWWTWGAAAASSSTC
jgi:hypothetical protein